MLKYLVLMIGLLGFVDLSAQPAELEAVVVTASRTPIPIHDSGSSISIISREDLQRRNIVEVSDALRSVPGIAVSRSGPLGAQTQVRVRGSEANHVLVLIDGVEANDPAAGDEFQFEHLTTDDIERIEVVRGPQSALWGSDAVGGIINVITRRGQAEFETSGHLQAGSFSTQHAGGRLSVARDAYGVDFAAAYLDADGDNISRQGGEKDGYRNSTVKLRARLDPSSTTRFEIIGRHTATDKQFDAVDFLFTGLATDADRSSAAEQSYLAATALFAPLSNSLTHELKVTYLDTDQNTERDGVQVTAFGAAKLGLYYQTSLPLGHSEAHSLTIAVDHEQEDFTQRGAASPFGDPNQIQTLDGTGYVLEYRGAPTGSLNLSAAVRYDESSAYQSVTTYRLAASYALQDTRFRGSVGSGQKSPTFGDRFGFFPDAFVGNPDLEPETSQGWEIGIEQNFGENFLVAATYFDEQLENEINGFVFDPASFQFTAANVAGISQRQGVELTLSARPTSKLDVSGSYTFIDSTQPDESGGQIDEIRRPQHLGSVNLNYAVGERANINLNLAYNGSQYDTFFPPFPEPSQRLKLTSYRLLTLAASFRLTPRIELFGRIENLLDEDYEDVLGFNTPGIAAFIGVRAER